jgi:DNA-binding protein H-NS
LKSTPELKAEIVALNKQLDDDIARLKRAHKARVNELESEIARRAKSEIKAARDQVLAVLAQHGLSVADLTGMVPKERKKPEAKNLYVSPDGSRKWNGMGRRPEWMKDQPKENFLVQA